MSLNACQVVASFMAYGILHMRGVLGKAGWRWLFLIEYVYRLSATAETNVLSLFFRCRGLMTLVIGITTFFMMPASPTQSRTWFRPNGWFTEREETIIVSRVLRDDPSKGDMHNREGLTFKRLWVAICDYDLWPIYILQVFGSMLAVVDAHTRTRQWAHVPNTDANTKHVPHSVFEKPRVSLMHSIEGSHWLTKNPIQVWHVLIQLTHHSFDHARYLDHVPRCIAVGGGQRAHNGVHDRKHLGSPVPYRSLHITEGPQPVVILRMLLFSRP